MKKILVIDDEGFVRMVFSTTLKDAGYEVETAESGKEGLALFEKGRFDLIFLDLRMPGMDGADCLEQIRKKNKNIPIYILTAFYSEYYKRLSELRKEGHAFEVMTKPLEEEKITALARKALGEETAHV